MMYQLTTLIENEQMDRNKILKDIQHQNMNASHARLPAI
jgi:hypothetical protein